MKKQYGFLPWIILCGAALFAAGCDDGGEGGLGGDVGSNDPNMYVAMGDSITEGYGASTTYPAELSAMLGKTVVNRGVGGARAGEGAAAVGGVLSRYRPGYLLILYGANDVIHGGDPVAVKEQLRSIIRAANNNRTIPVIATLTPMYSGHSIYDGGARELNAHIRALASEEGAALADLEGEFSGRPDYMQADGLHPNSTGLRAIALVFNDVL